MRVIQSIESLRRAIKKNKQKNQTIGFVPTMGALHEGHLSLMRKARRENDIVVVSIFVNPTQFGPKEDFKKYPREEKKDKLLAQKEKIDIIFYPSVEEMYPDGYLTYVEVDGTTQNLCGQFRPGHFRGVTTIVSKLLNIVAPDIFYIGQKDGQQAIVLKKMVADLNIPVAVKICPTIREHDGLALSSRNRYLTVQQRNEAPILFQSLKKAKQMVLSGEDNVKKIIQQVQSQIEKNSSSKIEYIECVDADSLEPLIRIQKKIMIALAVQFGKTRLIDNIIFST